MPNWKKLIVSGSDAELNSLNITTALTASGLIYPTIDGNLNEVLTTDGAGNLFFSANGSSVFPYTGSAIISGSLIVTGSSNLQGVTGSFTGSFVGDGSGLTGIQVDQVTTVTSSFTNITSTNITHNFNSKNILVSIYDTNDSQIVPETVTLTDNNNIFIDFASTSSGYAVIAKGGHVVSGSAVNSSNLDNQPGSYYLNFNNHTNNPFTQSANTITASGHFVPSQHETYDLGSSDLRWRDLYLSGSTINLGGTLITRDANGDIEFKESGTNNRRTLKVEELEIQRGNKSVRLKLDNNNKVRFEDSDSGNTLSPTYFKTLVSGSNTYNITHSLDEEFPIIQTYQSSSKSQVVPENIKSLNNNTVQINFVSNFKGYIVVKK